MLLKRQDSLICINFLKYIYIIVKKKKKDTFIDMYKLEDINPYQSNA